MTEQALPPPSSDDDLAAAVRSGDNEAYALLFQRHRAAATRVARVIVDPVTADDVVADSFRRLLERLHSGHGPTASVRAYLMQMVRNAAIDARRRNREDPVDPTFPGDRNSFEVTISDPSDDVAERSVVRAAFATLPARWRQVLWLTGVEDLDREAVARTMSLSPTAVSTIGNRARERLRAAYLDQHVGAADNAVCAEVRELMGTYVRGTASIRDQHRVRQHTDACDCCAEVLVNLALMNDSLGAVLLPALVGTHLVAGAGTTGVVAGWLAWIPRPHGLQSILGGAAAVAALGLVGVVGVGYLSGRPNDPGRTAPSSADSATSADAGAGAGAGAAKAVQPALAAPPSAARPSTTTPTQPAPSATPTPTASTPTRAPSTKPTAPPTSAYDDAILGPLEQLPSQVVVGLQTHVTVPVSLGGPSTVSLVLDVPGLTGYAVHRGPFKPPQTRRRGVPFAPWSCEAGASSSQIVCTISGLTGRAYLGIDLGYAGPTTLTATVQASAGDNADPDPANNTASVVLP